ncbi:hypothetical protein GGD81_002080 [Rhodobium orientis]|uniref:Fimbrial protein n=1 Tax=Rhodobium orientis TaxID=34017 RepID=A0A327JV13_9HYPH|nr:hypothetical protein [Rhodobium orientis]MBB4303042.1 hypothetical protein [Rhodobium orientis]MBK5949600.1 hypothetical protein [Rhodobium orientis]RAI29386.1 hypothetical protein CH339_03635 [Rhodobium orientis]
MTHPAFDDEDEAPLDPATERLQKKLRRLVLVSGLIMMLGLIAVFSVIVYRVVKSDSTEMRDIPANIEALVEDPLTGDIVSTSLDGRHLAVTFRTDAGLKVLVIDLDTADVLRRVTLTGTRD